MGRQRPRSRKKKRSLKIKFRLPPPLPTPTVTPRSSLKRHINELDTEGYVSVLSALFHILIFVAPEPPAKKRKKDGLESQGVAQSSVFHVLACYFFGFFCSFLFVCFWLDVAARYGNGIVTSDFDESSLTKARASMFRFSSF